MRLHPPLVSASEPMLDWEMRPRAELLCHFFTRSTRRQMQILCDGRLSGGETDAAQPHNPQNPQQLPAAADSLSLPLLLLSPCLSLPVDILMGGFRANS